MKALLAAGADMNLLEVNKPSILSFDWQQSTCYPITLMVPLSLE